jgi:hypothetical protein
MDLIFSKVSSYWSIEADDVKTVEIFQAIGLQRFPLEKVDVEGYK